MSESRRWDGTHHGRLFHRRGPVAAKLLSLYRSCCVFLEQCMFWCLRNEAGDGHFQTAGECRLPGISVRYQIMTGTPDTRVWTSLVDGQEASAIDAGRAWYGRDVLFQCRMRRAAAFWTEWTFRMREWGRWTRLAAASYNSLGGMLWMPELVFWQHRLSATERLDVVIGAGSAQIDRAQRCVQTVTSDCQ